MSRPEAAATGGGRPVSLRKLALPNEHGAWGFLLEPALLGLLLAPSVAGLVLVVGGAAAVLAQHPLSLALADRRRGRAYPRTRIAWRLALGYGLVAAAALGATVALAGRPEALLPLVPALPLALVQLGHDARHAGRALVAELCGAGAIGALAPMVALAGGWDLWPALSLWAVLALRSVPSILYVRARLALERDRPPDRQGALGASSAALLLAAALAAVGAVPALTSGAMVLLLARAALGLSRWRRPARAVAIGLRELAYGLTVVAIVALGYRLGV